MGLRGHDHEESRAELANMSLQICRVEQSVAKGVFGHFDVDLTFAKPRWEPWRPLERNEQGSPTAGQIGAPLQAPVTEGLSSL